MNIPEMTDPLGRHWDQPSRNEIEIDDVSALMTAKAFDKLAAMGMDEFEVCGNCCQCKACGCGYECEG